MRWCELRHDSFAALQVQQKPVSDLVDQVMIAWQV